MQLWVKRRLHIATLHVSRTIKNIEKYGHTRYQPRSWRKCIVNTLWVSVRSSKSDSSKILGTWCKKFLKETGVSGELTHRIVRRHLKVKPYKLRNAQLYFAASHQWHWILFTGEKNFTIETAHNHQNDRIWSINDPGTSTIM